MDMSVVIAAFNAESELPLQLLALAAQGWDGDWEVVIADNGSTDRTAERAIGMAQLFQSLRVIDAGDAPGQPHALNCGIEAALGDLILILDADDEVAPDYVAAMAGALRTSELVAARLDCESLNPPWVRSSRPPTQADGVGAPLGFLPAAAGCSIGFHRNLFERLGGFDTALPFGHDIDFCWRLGLAGVPVVFVPEAVLQYRYRVDLAGIFRQARGYGACSPKLYRRYRRYGMRRGSLRSRARFWLGPFRRLLACRSKSDAAALVFLAGFRWGLLQGSWENRTMYL